MPVQKKDWSSFDLTVVTTRFRLKHYLGSMAEQLEIETKRFLYLASKGDNVAPSDYVDEYWHAMILNTRLYEAYCNECFGKKINHETGIPKSTNAAREKHNNIYKYTLELYRKTFGNPDPKFWPNPDSAEKIRSSLKKYDPPYRIHIETTNHCNLNCEHCYPASSPKLPHHDLQVILNILEKAKKDKIKKITLTGGELLTRKDWKLIFKKSLEVCGNIYFITNGLLLSEAKLRWLAKQRVITSFKSPYQTFIKNSPVEIGVAISLDGLESNSLVRKNEKGIGVKFNVILEKIKAAVDSGLHVTVNTTVTNHKTAEELPQMYDILSKMNIDRWQLDQAYLAGRMKESELQSEGLAWLESAKLGYEYIVKKYLENYPKVPNWRLEIVQVFRYDMLFYGFKPARSLDEHPCSYHYGSVIVEEGNSVKFCPSLRNTSIGQITTEDSFSQIYSESKDFIDFLGKSISDLPCKDCRYGLLFHGGCRANSLSYAGKIWERDPICCSLSPFVEDVIVPLLPDKLKSSFYQSLQEEKSKPGDVSHPSSTHSWQRIQTIEI